MVVVVVVVIIVVEVVFERFLLLSGGVRLWNRKNGVGWDAEGTRVRRQTDRVWRPKQQRWVYSLSLIHI